mgnify:CR=1 FL=1
MTADPASQAEAHPLGTTWAYRARSKDSLVEILVLKHGTKRPARVLVRFVDPSFEGREEWVPPSRLKVPWVDVDAFRAEEARWDAVVSLSRDGDTTETDAAHRVFDLLFQRTWPNCTGGITTWRSRTCSSSRRSRACQWRT